MDGGGDYIIEGSPRPSAESQLPGVKFDAMRGSKRPRFPGLFRALFSSQICTCKQSAKKPESMRISACPVVNCPQPLVV